MFHLSGWNSFLYMFHCRVEEWWFGCGVGDGAGFRDEKKGRRGLFLFLFTFSPKSGKKRITCIYMPAFQYICYALFPNWIPEKMQVLQRDIKERSLTFFFGQESLWSISLIFRSPCIMILLEGDVAWKRFQCPWPGLPFTVDFGEHEQDPGPAMDERGWGVTQSSSSSAFLLAWDIILSKSLLVPWLFARKWMAGWDLDSFYLSFCDSVSMVSWLSWRLLYSWARHQFLHLDIETT